MSIIIVILICSACQPKKPKREFIIPIRKSDKNSKLIEKLKKLIEDGAATEEDQARLKILMEATSYFNPAEDNQVMCFRSHRI
jgi:hypothetical protein